MPSAVAHSTVTRPDAAALRRTPNARLSPSAASASATDSAGSGAGAGASVWFSTATSWYPDCPDPAGRVYLSTTVWPALTGSERRSVIVSPCADTPTTTPRCWPLTITFAPNSSPVITKKTRARNGTTATSTNGATTKPRRRGKRKTQRTFEASDGRYGTAMKTIELPNAGGSLTLSGTFNTFELAGDERALVFGVIDQMKAFEEKSSEEEP